MRAVRLAAIGALVLGSAALVTPALSASADTPPYTAVTTTAPILGSFGINARPVLQTGSAVTVLAGSTSSRITFNINSGAISLTPNGAFSVGTSVVYTTPGLGAYLDLSIWGTPCVSNASMNVLQADSSGGNLTDFAADISLTCSPGAIPLQMSLRWNSSIAYDADSLDQNGWNFGAQAAGAPGWAHTFTMTNTGTSAETVSSVSIPSGGSEYQAPTTTCIASSPLAPGASCTFTITPKPAALVGTAPTTPEIAYPG